MYQQLDHRHDVRPNLASSLHNLAVRLGDLGRRDEALAALDEGMAIRRTLSTERPEPHGGDLRQSHRVSS
ncbi:tetratricopeptide repeat protein [Streptomyces sp. NPDC051366]|uniref:tetratricopeptide repeat protein n=1 Tax=Streptomyces sp. NPDC051366 TaxID=3365652 RepID=UPI0037BCE3EA